MKIDALVVGSGPTGLTMALELARAGLSVRIIDKDTRPAQHSQALIVQARTLEQFQRYGIAEQAVSRGRKLVRAKLWSEGAELAAFSFDNVSSRYPYLLFLPQTETEALLNSSMECFGIQTERATELIDVTQRQEVCLARVRRADGPVDEIAARWVIGCDGAHSSVRRSMGIPFNGRGIPILFFLGDLEMYGPGVPGEELSVHFQQGDVVFMGRLSEKLVRVIVAAHTEQHARADREITIKDFQAAIDRANVQAIVRSAAWMTPFHVNDRQAERYRVGNIFIAGDASHIHSPVGGQGMNTGIQDAANLAWKLAAVHRGADKSILDSYETERAEVGRALLRFTERALRMASTVNPLIRTVRNTALPLALHFDAVRHGIAGFISETSIEYRSSSIVADHGGDGSLRAGDRMPDLELYTEGQTATLLQDWTSGQHLLISVNGGTPELDRVSRQMQRVQFVNLDTRWLSDDDARLIGSEGKSIVLRPDGYVGFRGDAASARELQLYARQDGLIRESRT